MLRRRLITYSVSSLLLVMLILAGAFIVLRTLSPSVSAKASCDALMEHTPGYGPWKVLPSTSATSVSYSDGVNTARCSAKQYGPIWIVVDLAQTLVSCNQSLGGPECPRRAYGVIQ